MKKYHCEYRQTVDFLVSYIWCQLTIIVSPSASENRNNCKSSRIFCKSITDEIFCLGIAFYIVQVVFSKIWLTYFKYGPLEWLWRSATYLKWQPFLKR